jgi:hypothetical protein
MRISYGTLALLAFGGDVDALNTMETWERKERPGKTDGRMEAHVRDGMYCMVDHAAKPHLRRTFTLMGMQAVMDPKVVQARLSAVVDTAAE